jgi:hypothetical protein
MNEIWLRANRRALWMGLLAPGSLAAVALACVFFGSGPLRVLGWAGVVVAGCVVGLILWLMRQPRLAYQPGYMLVYLRLGPPIRLPIEVVECFFLGSGPIKLTDHIDAPYRAVGLIVRLAEKAAEWADRPVKPALGRWHEGYILIHGAWCEPLSLEVVSRLNVRLHQIQHPSDDRCQSTSAAVSVATDSIAEAPSGLAGQTEHQA